MEIIDHTSENADETVNQELPSPEEMEKIEAESKEQFEKLVNSPITKEEAAKAFANLDIRRTQLAIVRQKWVAQSEAFKQQANQVQQKISMLDEELFNIELERAITFRRTLNSAEEKASTDAE